MNITELTKKIYDEYPKVWKQIIKYGILNDNSDMEFPGYASNIFLHNDSNIIYKDDNITIYKDKNFEKFKSTIWFSWEYEFGTEIPFEYLYVELEDFFEENGIIIIILYRKDIKKNYMGEWAFQIYEKERGHYKNGYYFKPEAKEQAILKACEILEGKLK
jgi:hypothetical protein